LNSSATLFFCPSLVPSSSHFDGCRSAAPFPQARFASGIECMRPHSTIPLLPFPPLCPPHPSSTDWQNTLITDSASFFSPPSRLYFASPVSPKRGLKSDSNHLSPSYPPKDSVIRHSRSMVPSKNTPFRLQLIPDLSNSFQRV